MSFKINDLLDYFVSELTTHKLALKQEREAYKKLQREFEVLRAQIIEELKNAK
jgi:hypothetical protein